jgi:geranylgeranyl diphosphate synthase type II
VFDLSTYLAEKRALINTALERILDQNPRRIASAMGYSLMAGGKRLRPILCMASAEAVGGGNPDAVLPAACALEIIHTYSLIHDDLPAMDDDALRRGRPTCHMQFDEATAILAGDGLLTLAFEILSAPGPDKEKNPLLWLKVIHEIAGAAGYRGMIEGQMQDMAAEGVLLPPEDLEKLHALKTGALIRASVRAGALVGGGSPDQIRGLEDYARGIGLAFQVTDDILNVEGDPALMGKAAGTDQTRKKNAYPALMGLEQSKELARNLIDQAILALDGFDEEAEPLRAIARYILHRKR